MKICIGRIFGRGKWPAAHGTLLHLLHSALKQSSSVKLGQAAATWSQPITNWVQYITVVMTTESDGHDGSWWVFYQQETTTLLFSCWPYDFKVLSEREKLTFSTYFFILFQRRTKSKTKVLKYFHIPDSHKNYTPEWLFIVLIIQIMILEKVIAQTSNTSWKVQTEWFYVQI